MPLDLGANLPLLKFLLAFLLVVFFPLTGLLVAGATISLVHSLGGRRDRDARMRRLAAGIARGALLPGGSAILIVLTAALIFLTAHVAYGLPAAAAPPALAVLVLLAVGLGLLYWYRSGSDGSIIPFLAGIGGTMMMVGSLFLLASLEGLLLHPESLPLLAVRPYLFVSWTGTARFLALTLLSFAAAAAILPHLAGDEPAEAERVDATGRGVLLAVLALWPPVAVFALLKLPEVARSAVAFILSAAGIALAAAVFLILLPRRTTGRPPAVPVLVAVLFVLWVAEGHVARENALTGPALVSEAAFGPLAARPAAPAPPPAAAPEVSPEAGRAVFERICSTCHRLDQRLVGPPLNEVVPKYQGRPEELQAFIRTPVKVNPEYPAMPKLGLSDADIAAVAAWLLQEVGK